MNKDKILEGVKAGVAALEDKKAIDVTVLDIRGLTTIADYFIIASAKNTNQLKAMADNVEEAMYKAGIAKKNTEGANSKSWILQDFGDIVVHLFDEESREFYDLERIWADAKKTEL